MPIYPVPILPPTIPNALPKVLQMTQLPTISGLRVRTTSDARIIFHAVRHMIFPIVRRRLDAEERRNIKSGDVFVWEERVPNTEASGLGIERWTDSIRWGPSRTRDDFLFYNERQPRDAGVIPDYPDTPYRRPLIKQTFSVYLELDNRRAKWHLIAYYTQDTLDQLLTVDDFPRLAELYVPYAAYRSARNPKRPARETNASDRPLPYHRYPYQMRDATSHEDAQGDGTHGMALAPLVYLQSIPPPRRHIVDEMALIRLSITINNSTFSPSHTFDARLHSMTLVGSKVHVEGGGRKVEITV